MILIAKTNPPEFSYSTETDNLLTGRTNNPWNLDYTPVPLADLDAESAELDQLVVGLAPAQWALPTPAPGWTFPPAPFTL